MCNKIYFLTVMFYHLNEGLMRSSTLKVLLEDSKDLSEASKFL